MDRMLIQRRVLMCAGAMTLGFGAAVVRADDGASPLGESASFRFEYPQPGADGAATAEAAAPAGEPRPEFGDADSQWWTVGANLSYGFNGSTDSGLYGSYSYFIAKDVEFAGELALWYFNQPGDNAEGASASMIFRWHFIDTGPWTVYVDAGIGVLGATNSVPEGGTSFDFMPRAGVGFTRLLSDDGLRLQVGLRWFHVSNARILGDENNPAIDQALVYAGIIFPF